MSYPCLQAAHPLYLDGKRIVDESDARKETVPNVAFDEAVDVAGNQVSDGGLEEKIGNEVSGGGLEEKRTEK